MPSGMSPTSPGSQSSFTAVESTFSFHAGSSKFGGGDMQMLHTGGGGAQQLMDFGYQFPQTSTSRDDGMAVYDTMHAARRPSQVAVQFYRGGAASDRLATVPLPSLADGAPAAAAAFEQFRGFGDFSGTGGGVRLGLGSMYPSLSRLSSRSSSSKLLMGEYISQRRNSEFRFPPPMRVFANPHQTQQPAPDTAAAAARNVLRPTGRTRVRAHDTRRVCPLLHTDVDFDDLDRTPTHPSRTQQSLDHRQPVRLVRLCSTAAADLQLRQCYCCCSVCPVANAWWRVRYRVPAGVVGS
ncbi:hypothetical protein BKA62DRAFT_357375 [Auriculariales sp. MPI-PUGE-AT-0066]|nr:hypothetical protein BKA62DRAFT_357375 [Auriculariales sp. MPI-PUGE-AT-0066]